MSWLTLIGFEIDVILSVHLDGMGAPSMGGWIMGVIAHQRAYVLDVLIGDWGQ
jgi:hypothetical protein